MVVKVKRIKGYIGKNNWGGRFTGRRGVDVSTFYTWC